MHQSVQAASRMWAGFVIISIPWQAAFVISAYQLVPRAGAIGLAWSYLTGVTTALICTAALVNVKGMAEVFERKRPAKSTLAVVIDE